MPDKIVTRFTGVAVMCRTEDGTGPKDTVQFEGKKPEDILIHLMHMQPGDSMILMGERYVEVAVVERPLPYEVPPLTTPIPGLRQEDIG